MELVDVSGVAIVIGYSLDMEKNQGPDWVLEALSVLGMVWCTRPH